jgi:hypothetical protein
MAMERARDLQKTVAGLVLLSLVFGSANSYALEHSQLGKHQVGINNMTFDYF